MNSITTSILKIPFEEEHILYCLKPTKNFTFGCAYKGMFLEREEGSTWYRKYHKGELFVCKDDYGKIRRMSSTRFAKKLN